MFDDFEERYGNIPDITNTVKFLSLLFNSTTISFNGFGFKELVHYILKEQDSCLNLLDKDIKKSQQGSARSVPQLYVWPRIFILPW